MTDPIPHPDYHADPSIAEGARCVCGGIRHWHAAPPYGCDDCDCIEFREDTR